MNEPVSMIFQMLMSTAVVSHNFAENQARLSQSIRLELLLRLLSTTFD